MEIKYQIQNCRTPGRTAVAGGRAEMPCIVFILDTSGSTATQTYTGFTIFEQQKNYIESFIRQRSREPRPQNDRYILLTTCERYPQNVKSSGKDGPPQIAEILRKLTPSGTSNIQLALIDAFQFVHVNRAQTAIDNYGWGRMVQNSEQVIFIMLTDGPGASSIPKDFKLEYETSFLRSDLTKEAYRWDQRLFICVFRLPSIPTKVPRLDIDVLPAEKLCAATGGRSFSITSHKQFIPSIETFSAVLQQHTIAVRFEPLNPNIRDPSEVDPLRAVRMKYRKSVEMKPVTQLVIKSNAVGRPVPYHWCIPESFWPVKNMDSLPPRSAHPVIMLAPEAVPVFINPELPFDKIEMDLNTPTSEYVQELLQGRRDFCVPMFVEGSGSTAGYGQPFGCLKSTSNGAGINFIMLPYNFPMFYSLHEDLKDPSVIMKSNWRLKFDSYLAGIPVYQSPAVRKAFQRYKIRGGLMEEQISMSTIYAPGLVTLLSRLKNAGKEEFDRVTTMCSLIFEREMKKPPEQTIRVERITSRTGVLGIVRNDFDDESRGSELEEVDPKTSSVAFCGNLTMPLSAAKVQTPTLDSIYRNPLTASTLEMINNLTRLQANCELMLDVRNVNILDGAKPGLRARFHNLEELHNLSISSMGNYDNYIKTRQEIGLAPLRELEPPVRPQAFGNPFKVKNLTSGTGIDEVMDSQADASMRREKRAGESINDRGAVPPKRRKGPLGLDAFVRWREVQSMSSGAGSVVSSLSLEDNVVPSTSNGSSEIIDYSPIDEVVTNGLDAIIEKMNPKKGESEEEVRKNGKVPPVVQEFKDLPLESLKIPRVGQKALSLEEMTEKKRSINRIVRRPANAKAYEEIVASLAGTTADQSVLLLFALRESQRFKCKKLTDRIKARLKNEAIVTNS
ncbi:unnamed protein product [Caenorhabditis auriculariae]|uniref:VWFA domain-containing protein n=1 Tax=Caenorhabditis auriculariae TaxID=2777116 RepID=A0A8S1H6X9_9PELO|nr:unnamed protein product [Caenorhabditis auriculariae]